MSLHTDLDIYQTADSLFDKALDLQKHYPRELRLVLGARVVLECTEMLVLVGRANKARQGARIAHLEELAEHIEAAILLLRASQRKRAISTKAWSETVAMTDSLAKQCGGWLKQARAANNRAPERLQLPMQEQPLFQTPAA